MKIGEAQKAYRQQLNYLRGQKRDFVKQQKENRDQMDQARKKSEEQGVTFEFSEAYLEREKELQEKIDELSGQIKNSEKTLDELIDQETGIFNSIVAEQQGDAWKEYGEEMAKCLEIARRISRGDRVPAQDEKKLMDFNMEIYQMAKEMAAMNMEGRHKEWDSLWGEEEEKEYEDPFEASQNAETNVEMPEGTETAADTEQTTA